MWSMSIALRQRLVVKPGGVIEIRSLELPVGSVAEVIVIVDEALPVESVPSQPDTATEWPHGFFEETFGCLRDEPLVREPQVEYDKRDELKPSYTSRESDRLARGVASRGKNPLAAPPPPW